MPTHSYEGCRFAFELRGQGEPVVFIQGVGLHGAGWNPQTSYLSKYFHCITFDNRGMGESQPVGQPVTVDQMARDTCALIDVNGHSSVHLVGHSLGGLVALQIALANSARVRSVALLCTSGRGADATRLTAKMIWLGIRSRVGTRRMRRLAFMRFVLSPERLKNSDLDLAAQELAPLFGHDLADTPPVVLAQLGALKRYDASSRLSELASLPTLVLAAENDVIFPPRCGRQLAAAIPGSRLVEIPRAAHGVTIECADEVNRLLREHIQRAETLRQTC